MNTNPYAPVPIKKLGLRVPEALWRQLVDYAKAHHRSVHGLILDLAQEGMAHRVENTARQREYEKSC